MFLCNMQGLLRSFCATATRGFRYNFYVAHDHYDPFFQHQHSHSEFTEVFYEMVSLFVYDVYLLGIGWS